MRLKIIFVLFLSCVAALLLVQTAVVSAAPARRALLIGINDYEYSHFADLPYPSNDLALLTGLLSTPRYGFADLTIMSTSAVDSTLRPTRANILAAMRKFLEIDCRTGDVCLFYYSGHGSRVLNTLSRSPKEDDRFDETIVPMDADRPQVDAAIVDAMSERERLDMFNTKFRDIRDKEIGELLNIAARKGVVLTAIFDSCHSGSIGRGPTPGKSADAIDGFDLRVKSRPPAPEENGAIILSAAKDYQLALGGTYEFEGKTALYSHFTAAILKTLYRSPADTIARDELFDEARAEMVSDPRTNQTPVIEGQEKYRLQTLFGEPSGQLTGRIRVSVVKENQSAPARFIKGIADGIGVGAIFTRIGPATAGTSPLRVRVTKTTLKRSEFEVMDNGKPVAAGDVFEQTGATPFTTPNLTVWLPPAVDDQSLAGLTEEIKRLDEKMLAKEPLNTSEAPEQVYLERSAGSPTWKRRSVDMTIQTLGSRLTADMISRTTRGDGTRVFVSLPPTIELREKLTVALSSAVSVGIEIAEERDRAMYELAGRLTPQGVVYGWILISATIPSDTLQKAAMKDETVSLSRTKITDWRSDADELVLMSVRLAKIGDLLRFDAPQQAGGSVFPYVLETRDSRNNLVPRGGQLSTAEKYRFVLKYKIPRSTAKLPLRFYAYLINIDSTGARDYTAYMIGDCGDLATEPALVQKFNGAKKFGERCRNYSKAAPPAEIVLVEEQVVCPPVGSDTEIIVFTDQRWEDVEPSRSFQGVRGLKWNVKPRDLRDVFPRKQFGFDGTQRGPGEIKDWAIQYQFFSSVLASSPVDALCEKPPDGH